MRILIIAWLVILKTSTGSAQSALDCIQALHPGDNLGYLRIAKKSELSTVMASLPINTTARRHTTVGWLYIDQFGLEWVQLNKNATATTRRWFKIAERTGTSGVYGARYPAIPSWLLIGRCN